MVQIQCYFNTYIYVVGSNPILYILLYSLSIDFVRVHTYVSLYGNALLIIVVSAI